mmetsp:Transcript_26524/g.61912  ORF Transcript_26524/g.61912 Transcript_26524/m.61912 type:complete len:209 (+) Transcript_26524:626-1252(+)
MLRAAHALLLITEHFMALDGQSRNGASLLGHIRSFPKGNAMHVASQQARQPLIRTDALGVASRLHLTGFSPLSSGKPSATRRLGCVVHVRYSGGRYGFPHRITTIAGQRAEWQFCAEVFAALHSGGHILLGTLQEKLLCSLCNRQGVLQLSRWYALVRSRHAPLRPLHLLPIFSPLLQSRKVAGMTVSTVLPTITAFLREAEKCTRGA